MSITYQELQAKIRDLENTQLDLGPAYKLNTAYLEIFGGGSGKVIIELHRTDHTTPAEKLANIVGATKVQKTFLYDTETELLEILEDIQAGIYPTHYDPNP